MSWCPNCGAEYRQGYKTCKDCNIDLVDELEPSEANKDQDDDNNYEEYLTSDYIEAEANESYRNINILQLLEKIEEKERPKVLKKDTGFPWCPVCGVEYRQEYKTCSDCNVDLVTGSESDIIDDNNIEKSNENSYGGESHLISLNDPTEADIIESLLLAKDIPVLKKLTHAGGFLEIYMGTTTFGVELYVPEKLLDEAREIIENSRKTVEKDDEIFNEYKNKRKFRAWIILLLFIPEMDGLIIAVVVLLWWIMQ